jgi:hypothetical protein
MNFANPSAFVWAAIAVPIVIFYILKIRLRRVPISTVLFWRQIFDEKKPRSLWERLRHLISLLCQIVLLALLVGALTEPFFSWELLQARRVVLIIDNSASMKATDVAPSRFERAKEEGQRIIGGLRFRDEMVIVAAASQPRVVCGLTGNLRKLREALAAVPATDGPSKIADAVALARRMAGGEDPEGGKRTTVIVLSDACAPGAVELAKADDTRFVLVGERTGNVGISGFQVRRSPLDPTGYEILAEVVNQSDDPIECRFELELNGAVQEVIPLKLEANGKWSQVLEKVSVAGGELVARLTNKTDGKLEYADALASDNRAVALLPKREYQSVFLTWPAANLFLEQVFKANPLVRLTTLKEPPALVPTGAVQVFHRKAPNPLPAGSVLVIDPETDCELWTVGEKLQNPIVTFQDKDSPLMAHVRLDNVILPEARKLSFTGAAGKPKVLAGSITGDALFAQIERPGGSVVVLTVNLDLGDLPFRTAFPILISNTLSEFAGGRGELQEALPTGATPEVNVPSVGSIRDLVLRAPDGGTQKLPQGASRFTIGPLDQAGIWSVIDTAPAETPVQRYACNIMNRAASDLRPPAELAAVHSADDTGLVSGLFGRPIWFVLIALAWLLVSVEWYLYQRRWIS